MTVSVQELADTLNGRFIGRGDVQLADVAPLSRATAGQLTFAESRKQLASLRRSEAGAVLVNEDLAAALGESKHNLIIVGDSHSAFVAAMLLFRPRRPRVRLGISSQAAVGERCSIGEDTNIFAGARIGDDARIGNSCDIGPGVVIGEGCVIGDGCVIHANCVLYPDVVLGNRVIVHANAVLGADGFGYRFVNGAFERIPHTGTVIIEDDVEIGACTTIDRGMIEATVIGRGSKLDNQVMIAHNCRVGRHNVFASQVGLAGSVTTGDYVQMGGQVGVADHVQIGNAVKCGGKAGIMDDLVEPGVYHGIPAMPEKEAIKNHLNQLKLPQLREQVKQLLVQVAELQRQMEGLSATPSQRSAA